MSAIPLLISVALATLLGSDGTGNGWNLSAIRGQGLEVGRDVVLERIRQQQAEQLAAVNVAAAAAIVTAQQRAARLQRDAALIDEIQTRKLADALAENDALRRRLERGERMRIAGTCAPDGLPGPAAATGAAGVGDGAIDLSPAARRAAADLRASLIKDQNKLETLQRYIRDVCLVR